MRRLRRVLSAFTLIVLLCVLHAAASFAEGAGAAMSCYLDRPYYTTEQDAVAVCSLGLTVEALEDRVIVVKKGTRLPQGMRRSNRTDRRRKP